MSGTSCNIPKKVDVTSYVRPVYNLNIKVLYKSDYYTDIRFYSIQNLCINLWKKGAFTISRSEGTWGEALVADYLRGKNYRLAAHSYRCRFGEIDLIAWDKDVLCFVEVKTRTNTQMGLPREYVTPQKQARIRKTALFYLCENDLDCPARFDVAEVYAAAPGDENSVRIEYLEDAFQ